eukprot:TRINITY_DN190_c0_g1_i1.p1 TRINITY_DN190_c0_g1~~TRINITY_DN190_c0_g1_i1.p1  ORF type:complete len:600 (-),score=91.96 TRINITY_DN190_c0_g1_i1:129-1928(-)
MLLNVIKLVSSLSMPIISCRTTENSSFPSRPTVSTPSLHPRQFLKKKFVLSRRNNSSLKSKSPLSPTKEITLWLSEFIDQQKNKRGKLRKKHKIRCRNSGLYPIHRSVFWDHTDEPINYSAQPTKMLNKLTVYTKKKVPVVVITGSPTRRDQKLQPLLHHSLGDYAIPRKMFEKITAASTTLSDPKTAGSEIDRVLETCLAQQAPVYISLPSDMVYQKIEAPDPSWKPNTHIENDDAALNEAVDEALDILAKSQSPVILSDVEVIRYGLQKELENLLEKSGLPYATLIMGKTVLNEDHPQFIGIYSGATSRQFVRDRVENADCVIQFGVLLSDLNTGGFSVKLDINRVINVHHNKIKIKNHTYADVSMKKFMDLLAQKIEKRSASSLNIKPAFEGCVHRRSENFKADPSKEITIKRFFDRIAHYIPENAVVVAETGNSLFSTAETMMPKGVTYISQVFYGSIGYTLGASLGASLADLNRRVVLFIGDGSLQVTAPDLSTMIKNKANIVVFVMNNDGYLIERLIIDGSFNDIQPWKYHLLPEAFGGNRGYDVRTEGELEDALDKTRDERSFSLIEFHTDKWDATPALKIAGEEMRKNTQG